MFMQNTIYEYIDTKEILISIYIYSNISCLIYNLYIIY